MDLSKKALYTSLRLNYREDPSLAVEKWQIEDLTRVPPQELFDRIAKKGVLWDKTIFIALSEEYDTPEEMAEALSEELSPKEADQFYLIVFELWRRFLSERKTLTLFADELDRQIALYDLGKVEDFSAFQDAMQNLLMIFQDSEESGLGKKEFMASFSRLMAHDLEEFLYDFLSEEIEANHLAYVADFVETMAPFVKEGCWFDLLRIEASPPPEGEEFQQAIKELIKKQKTIELDFLLEVAAFLAKRGDEKTYGLVAKKIIPLLAVEEDFIDFLDLSADFFRLSDEEEKEALLEQIILSRQRESDAPLSPKDIDLKRLQELLPL